MSFPIGNGYCLLGGIQVSVASSLDAYYLQAPPPIVGVLGKGEGNESGTLLSVV